MLRPDGANLFLCRELASPSFGQRSVNIRGFLRRELIGWLIEARELQENPRKIVLRLIENAFFSSILPGFESEAQHAKVRDRPQ